MRRSGTVAMLALVAGCATGPAPAPEVTGSPASSPGAAAPVPLGSLDLAARLLAADAFARGQGGVTGIVVRDRFTGEVRRNAAAATRFRAGSTVKLAIAVDLLTRARAGEVRLSAADRAALREMIVYSDNAAADRLWARAGPGMTGRLAAYGLRAAIVTADWDRVRCTPEDLARLVSHVLDGIHPADRMTLVGLLRAVEPRQRWGVFGVVGTSRPGAKNGWLPTGQGWAVATAGFVGPGERYAVAVMTTGRPTFVAGVQTVTGTVTTLFLGLS